MAAFFVSLRRDPNLLSSSVVRMEVGCSGMEVLESLRRVAEVWTALPV